MKRSLKKALKLFKYLSIVFALVYWVGVVIDDWSLVERYWKTAWPEYLEVWSVYFLIYFAGFSICFWVIAFILVAGLHLLTDR
jgi:hypothetical protein